MHALRLIHRWVGLIVALPVVLVAISGSLLVGRDAYYRLRWPAVADGAATPDIATQAHVLASIETRFAQDGVAVIKFPRPQVNAFYVYLRDDTEALVHARTGELLGRWDWTSDAMVFLFELHAHLLAGASGKTLNGYLALVLLFFGLSGVILWLPARRATFPLRRAWPRSTSAADMLRSHAASGIWLVLPVGLFAATGAGIVFYEPVGRAASAMLDTAPPVVPSAVVPPQSAIRADWTTVLNAVNHALPEAGPAMYYPGTSKNAAATFRKRLPGEWHPNGRSYVLVDPYSGVVVQTIDARQQGRGTRMMHALYPIHAATVGGPAFVTVAALTGAGLGWLAVGSVWSYLGRRARRRRVEVAGTERRYASP